MKEMVATLKKPRRVMMLVKAGSAVDAFIEQLVSLYKPFCCSAHHSAWSTSKLYIAAAITVCLIYGT